MKKTKTAVMLLLVAVLLCAALLGGCTKTDKDQAETATKSPKEADKEEVLQDPEEPIEISYWAHWCLNAEEDNFCEKIIEEAIGIDIKTVMISQTETEQINLMLTSGEMPDCGWFSKDFNYMYYDNELARTIPKDMVEQNAPTFAQLFKDEPILDALVTVKEDDTQIYGLSTYQANAAGHQYFFTDFYRKDWLDNLGIEYPGTLEEVVDGVFMSDNGYTLEQHRAVLEAFSTQDPDGNGVDDTVGTIGAGDGWLGPVSWTMLGAYDLCEGYSVEDNGKAVYYYSTERYKQVLAYVRDLYKDGLIDAEIFTLEWPQFYEKAQNSFGGHFVVSANWLGSWAMNRPPMNILSNIEGSEIIATPGIIGPDGDMGSRQWAAEPIWGGQYFYVNKKVTDDNKLSKILQFVEYSNFGDRFVELMFGEEGVDFYYDDDNMPVRSIDFTEENTKGIQAFCLYMQDREKLSYFNDAIFRATEGYTMGDGVWTQHLIAPYKHDLYQDTDIANMLTEYKANLDTIVGEFRVSVIAGDIDLDTEWQGYLDKLSDAGYDEVCAELDKAPLYSDLIN